MPDQPNIALVLEGSLWEVPVKLQLLSGAEFQHGQLKLGRKGDKLDLRPMLKLLLDTNLDIKLPADLEVYFFNKSFDTKSAKALGAIYGGLDFQYCWGPEEGASGFFVRLKLDDLLKQLPGLPSGTVSGHVAAGLVKKQVCHFAPNASGTWEATETRNGFAFGGVLEIAGERFDLKSPDQALFLPGEETVPPANTEVTELANGDVSPPKWVDLGGRKAGPITLHGLAFSMNKGVATILIRAEMTLGGLSLALLGVGVDVTLSELMKKPLEAFKFRMQGLGLSYHSKGFTIAGFFEKLAPNKEAYAGGVLLKTRAFAITGVGAYSQEDGYKSIFGYLSVDVNLGGPPSFFVLGLVACFGYNRQLLIPSIDKLNSFPLVRYAIDSSIAPDFGKSNPIVQFNQHLAPYIPPKKHHMFFGIGVKFSTYKLVTTVAMLTVAKGEDLEFNLLGISRFIIKPPNTDILVVFVEMALRGAYSVNKGLMQIEGRLSNQSYIFSQSVKLTGGFAFYAWFEDYQSAKAGDFVITLGGYHSDFKVPAHYPKVPRLGFEWKVGENLSLSGKMYLALTPVAIMAGGAFEALFKAGPLKAAFQFSIDFLISWKPFFYDARLRVSIHISYRINTWLVKRTVSLDLNVKLHVWGPDFTGRALLEFRVCRIGFSIPLSFGSAPKKPKLLKWTEFKHSFISSELNPNAPVKDKQSKLISILAREGLLDEQTKQGTKTWVLNPKEATLAIESVIPITQISINGKKIGGTSTTSYCIPLVKAENVSSRLEVKFQRLDNGSWKNVALSNHKQFFSAAQSKNLPRSVWNDKVGISKTDQLSADTSLPLTVGVLIGAKETKDERQWHELKQQDFQGDAVEPVLPSSDITSGGSSLDEFLVYDRKQYPDELFLNTPLDYALDDSNISLTEKEE